ncbi:MAG: YfhO family protein [Prevotellaceae bacterium]|jgi:hypothetical protein|nr:YfhO family protein [Prevotellaceae bacterium]
MKKIKTLSASGTSTQKWWHFLLPVVFFVAISAAYFSPVLKGKIVHQSDVTKWEGMAQEVKKFYEETGESSCWTGSMFSGMPTYQIASYGIGPTNYVSYLSKPFAVFESRSMSIVVLSLVAFYLLMLSLGANIWLAAAGAIAFTFSSYSFIIIEAGHVTKAYAIAYIPLVAAGILMAYRGKLVLGAAVTAAALSLQIGSGHYQITYYLIFIVLGLVLSYFFYMLKQKQLKQFIAASCALALAAVFAVSVNSVGIYANYEMGKESIRGASELTAVDGDAGQPKSSGLDKDYAFAWSYGKAETFSLLIPNIHGGASGGELDASSEVYKAYKARGAQLGKSIQSYTYWGEQPFTSGPVYLGAVVCFLFIFGLFVWKHPVKWWLLGLTVLSIFLSWGKNMEWFNDFLFYHLPFYSKFRTPSMVLVIAQFTVPLLALLTLKDLFEKKIPLPDLKKGLKYALGIAGGICLIFAVMPGVFFDFRSSYDATYDMPDWYYTALLSDRASMLRSDAVRSLAFIVLAAGVLYFFMKGTLKSGVYATVAIAALVLVDLWQVDKRYLNDSSFVYPKTQKQPFAKSKADELILQDTSQSYRVLSLNNPFNDSFVSYYHKSIGGYHGAKLRRYQELIERRISPEIQRFSSQAGRARSATEMEALMSSLTTLNMLNMRYIIHSKDAEPIRNDAAYGNAWFVEDFRIVENADAEMAMLGEINPLKTAIVDKRFEQHLAAYQNPQADENATISMTKYKPNAVTYTSRSNADRLAVFSEVYYAPGWEAYVDGQPAPHFRTSWILRGMVVPAGEHKVEFKFYPNRYYSAIKASRASSAVLLLVLAGGIAFALYRAKTTSNLSVG